MKSFWAIVMFVVIMTIGFFTHEFTGARTCQFTYDTTFNGLYITKHRHCYGPSGMVVSDDLVSRRPLFREF